MKSVGEGRAALLVLAASGLAWSIAAIVTGSTVEWLYCGTVLVGFTTALSAGIFQKRTALATGFAVAAVGNLAPVVVYREDIGTWAVPWLFIAAGLTVAAIAASRRSASGRLGMLAVLAGALWILMAFDLSVSPSIWTIGNTLLVVGAALAAWRFPTIV